METSAATNDAAIDCGIGATGDCGNGSNTPNVMETKTMTIVKTEPVTEVKTDQIEQTPQISFTCKICDFKMPCQYKGKRPRFAKNIQFHEECYQIQDPFSPPPGHLSSKSTCEHFIAIGSDCSRCTNAVCQLNSCSIFYLKTYCSECAYHLLNTFPAEVQCKIRKFCKRPTE